MVEPAAKGLLVFGIGLGYHLQALRELFPQKDIICFEPDPTWPDRLAEQNISLENLTAGTLFPDSPNWQEALRSRFHDGYQLIALESCRRAYPALFAEVDALHTRYNSRDTVNRNTLKRFGARWVENLLINFLCLEGQQSINPMRGRFSSLPALLLAGGPTLHSVLPLLKDLRQRMIILTVDTSYACCREVGIEPDFLIAVDPQYWNTKHFERVEPAKKAAILISESSAHPRTFRLLNRRPCFCGSLFPMGSFFEQSIPPRDRLGAGGSVTTTAWDFLKYIGATQIYTAGMDMGFPERETHFRGSYFEETIAMTGNALHPAETAALSYLFSGQPEYRESYTGEPVLSDRRMDLYCQWFEHQIQQDDRVRGFALSEKSRRIPGMELTDRNHLLSLPDIRKDIDERLQNIRTSLSQGQETGDRLNEAFQSLQTSMSTMSEQCRKALKILDGFHHNNSVKESVIEGLNEIDSGLLSDGNRQIAGFLINDAMNSLAGLPNPQTFQDAMHRSEKLYRELLTGIETHIRIFRKARIKISRLQADNNKIRGNNTLC